MREPSSGTVHTNGINIYYEVHGSGEPLLLIEGLGYSSWMWYKQVPVLSKSHKVIIFDNRGAGNTDKPDSEYTVELMAEDAAGLLSELGVESAHVLGVSLGGYIAQELEKQFPEFVNKPEVVEGKDVAYTVNYAGMSAVAIKGIQEQQEMIEAQAKTIATLQENMARLQQRLEQLER